MTACLVTGGAGFIGSHLVTRLLDLEYEVRVLDDFSTGARTNLEHVRGRFELVEGSVANRESVARAVDGVELVFHQAALASVPRSIENPLATHTACATGTAVVLEEARRAGVRRVVYAGSSSAYGNCTESQKSEDLLPSPLSPYAAAKLAGEHYCRAFAECTDLETVALRYFNVFGPRQDPNSPYAAVVPIFASALLSGRRPVVHGDGGQSRDFTFVENVVEANVLASHAPDASGRVYNVGCGRSYTVNHLLQSVCEYLRVPFDPEYVASRAGDVRHSLADTSAAERDLGYHPSVDFHEGLSRTLDWYVESCSLDAAVSPG